MRNTQKTLVENTQKHSLCSIANSARCFLCNHTKLKNIGKILYYVLTFKMQSAIIHTESKSEPHKHNNIYYRTRTANTAEKLEAKL